MILRGIGGIRLPPGATKVGEFHHSRGGASQYLFLLAAVGGVILAIVGIYFWNTSRKQRVIGEEPDATPEDLLAELFRVHELSRAEQTLVTLLAKTEPCLNRHSSSSNRGQSTGRSRRAIPNLPAIRHCGRSYSALELSGVPEAQTWDFPVRFSI